MQQTANLLPAQLRRLSREDVDDLSRLTGESREGILTLLELSRQIPERTLPKKRNQSQYRVLAFPPPEFKEFNKRLKTLLYRTYQALDDPVPHGYVRGRSIWTGLARHFEGERLETELAWFGFDLADAFPSVSHRWVDRVTSEIFPMLSAPSRAVLVNLLCFRGRLDQGYPTSPVVFNLALRPLDERLQAYCEPRGITYTRYADDFTFSAARPFSTQERRELVRIAAGRPFRFRVVKVSEAGLGADFLVTHRSTHRFRRRLLRDQSRGLSVAQTIANLQHGAG